MPSAGSRRCKQQALELKETVLALQQGREDRAEDDVPELPATSPAAIPRGEIPADLTSENRFGTFAASRPTLHSREAERLRRHGGSPEPAEGGSSATVTSGSATGGGPSTQHSRSTGGGNKRNRCAELYDVLLVIDFEATCDNGVSGWPHEIIEFPVVALHTRTKRVVAEFHRYVRPVLRPRLSRFCTELTGITQAQVDAATTLPEVIAEFQKWHATTFPPDSNTRTVVATDGPWDMRDFMHRDAVVRDGIAFPPLFYRWINLRKAYATHFKIRPIGLGSMLTRLGKQFEGRPHSGIDDARNIARIAASLISRGCALSKISTIGSDAERCADSLAAFAEAEREL